MKPFNAQIILLLICATLTLSYGTGSAAGASDEKITINASQPLPSVRPLIGFVHGITDNPSAYPELSNYDQNKTIDLISQLNPRFWRLSNHDNDVYSFISKGDFVRKHGTQLMFVMEDTVNVQIGYDIKISPLCPDNKPTCFKTFEDFKSLWTRIHTAVINEIVANNYPISYFEVFGEPINVGFGKVNTGSGITGITPEQLADLFKTTHDIIRAVKPAAKIGGPGWIAYNNVFFSGFLDYIVQHNLTLDFFSWHEFAAPEDVVAHVSEARKLLSDRPTLCHPTCPEIHITEFNRDVDVHNPGAALGWFHYLEKSRVDWASSACWNVVKPNGEPGDICWSGMDGVLMTDNVTTTNIYWVYKKYSEMTHQRLQVESTKVNTVALADYDLANSKIRVLVGRYGKKSIAGNVTLAINALPFATGNVKVEIWKIPVGSEMYHQLPLANPIKLGTQNLNVVNRSVSGTLQSLKDGDVYYVEVSPL